MSILKLFKNDGAEAMSGKPSSGIMGMLGVNPEMLAQAGQKLIELDAFVKRQDEAMKVLLAVVQAQTNAINGLSAQIAAMNSQPEKQEAQNG